MSVLRKSPLCIGQDERNGWVIIIWWISNLVVALRPDTPHPCSIERYADAAPPQATPAHHASFSPRHHCSYTTLAAAHALLVFVFSKGWFGCVCFPVSRGVSTIHAYLFSLCTSSPWLRVCELKRKGAVFSTASRVWLQCPVGSPFFPAASIVVCFVFNELIYMGCFSMLYAHCAHYFFLIIVLYFACIRTNPYP